MRRTKQQVIDEITALVAADPLTVSTGSTEPKAVFDAVNARLGLDIDDSLSKPQYAEAICATAGVPWDRTCDSRHTASGGGSTVTLVGLERVLAATRHLVAHAQEQSTSAGVLPASTPLEDEVRRILDVLDRDLPVQVDGRTAILQMKAEGLRWRDTEWAGFYFEHLARQALVRELGGDLGPKIANTEFDYKLIRVFDIKTHSLGSSSTMWLNDVEAVDAAALRTGGVGFIIIAGHATLDEDGSFRAWHEALKGGPSQYSLERQARGVKPRPRKRAFRRNRIDVVHLSDIEILRQALLDGWLKVAKQGRQSSGGPRKDKYHLVLARVPAGCRHSRG